MTETTGRSAAELRSLAAAMPVTHFYVVFQRDRRSWEWASPLAVGAYRGDDIDLYGYTAAGDSFQIDKRSRDPARPMAFLYLGPNEPVLRRPTFLQMPMIVDPRFIEGAAEVMRQECYPIEECGGGGEGGGGGSPPDQDTLYLEEFQTENLCDNLCGEQLELQIWATAPGGVGAPNVYCGGVPSGSATWPGHLCDDGYTKLHGTTPNDVSEMLVDAKEQDWTSGDDSFEEDNLTRTFENWLTITPNTGGVASKWMCDHDSNHDCTTGRLRLQVRWLGNP